MKTVKRDEALTVARKMRTLNGRSSGGAGGYSDHGSLLGLADDDHTQYLRTDGTRTLTGNMAVDPGITIDGVDISAFASTVSAALAAILVPSFLTLATTATLSNERQFVAGAGLTPTDGGAGSTYTVDVVAADTTLTINANDMQVRLATNSGLTVATGLTLGTPGSATSTSTNAVSTTTHTHAIDSTIARANVTLTAGAGLTGGGDLSANRTFTVVSGNTAIVVNADDITLTLASNSGLTISSGLAIDSSVAGAGLTWTTGVLAVVSGNTGIVVNANDITLTLASNSGLSISSGLTIASTVAGAGLTWTTGVLDIVSGNSAIVVNANDITLTLNATSGLEISTGLRIADSIAGAGLTIASKVLAVGAGSGITVNADDVALAVPGVMSVASLNSAAGATAAVPTVVSGTAVSTSAAAASLAVTVDGSAAAGHKLFCVVATRGNTVTVNTPDGWELQETVAQTNVTMTVFSRIARTGDASSTVTLTFTGSVNAAAVIIRSPDAIAGEFVNIDGSNTNASSTSVVINSVTTTLNNCLMLTISTWASAAAMTVDASTTELVEKVSTDASNNVGLNVAYYTQATAGATGSKTHTLGSGAGQAVGQIAVIPVASGGHQHYIGATYRPGASAILMTDANGYVGVLRLGAGVTTPTYPLHARATTEQMRLEYSASQYTSFTVGSAGDLTISPLGSVTIDTRGETGGSASVLNSTSATNATQTSLTIDTETTGTAAAGLGGSALFRVEDNGGTVRSTGYLSFTWTVATSASRSGKFALAVYDVSTANELLTGASNAGVIITQPVRASTTSPAAFTVTGGAHTTANLAEIIDVDFNLQRTVQFSGGLGDLATQRAFVVRRPSYAFSSAQTITTAATLAITGAPTAGTNATITTPLALWVQEGNVLIEDGEFKIQSSDGATSGATVLLELEHNSTGTAAGGFGILTYYRLESSTTDGQLAAADLVSWNTATHASRKAARYFYVYDTAQREAMQMVASGSAPAIGFLGAGAALRQTVTGSRGGNAALASLLTALATFGLITDSSS